MREIKFRGKDEWDNWRYGDLMKNSIPTASPVIVESFYYDDPDDSMFEVDPETVGQFTGLYDTDEREIYEGDVLDIDGDFIAEVVYCNGAYELYTKQGPLGKLSDISYEYSLAILDGVIETFSVIGNIHDSPYLLEKRP